MFGGFYMASIWLLRVSCVCVTFVTLINGCGYAYGVYQGRQRARVPPPPPRAERRLGYPQANFFYFFPSKFFIFFLPTPITSSISPFFLSLRGFLFLYVYFLIRLSFRVSEGKNTAFPILSASMWLLCALFSFYILILCYFLCCVFRLYLPIVLLSVLCLCIVFCCGCCVFR